MHGGGHGHSHALVAAYFNVWRAVTLDLALACPSLAATGRGACQAQAARPRGRGRLPPDNPPRASEPLSACPCLWLPLPPLCPVGFGVWGAQGSQRQGRGGGADAVRHPRRVNHRLPKDERGQAAPAGALQSVCMHACARACVRGCVLTCSMPCTVADSRCMPYRALCLRPSSTAD